MKKLAILLLVFFACTKPIAEDQQPQEINVIVFSSGYPYMVTGDMGKKMLMRDFSYSFATCETPPFQHQIRKALSVGKKYNISIQRLNSITLQVQGDLLHFSFTVKEGCNSLDVMYANGWN